MRNLAPIEATRKRFGSQECRNTTNEFVNGVKQATPDGEKPNLKPITKGSGGMTARSANQAQPSKEQNKGAYSTKVQMLDE